MVETSVAQTKEQIDAAKRQIAEDTIYLNEIQARLQQQSQGLTSTSNLLTKGGLNPMVARQELLRKLESSGRELSTAQGEISSYSSQVGAVESKLQNYIKEQKAYESAYKMWKDQIPYGFAKGTPEYKYLKELWQDYGNAQSLQEQRQANRAEFQDAIKQAQSNFNVDRITAIKIVMNPSTELPKLGYQGVSTIQGEGFVKGNQLIITKPNEAYVAPLLTSSPSLNLFEVNTINTNTIPVSLPAVPRGIPIPQRVTIGGEAFTQPRFVLPRVSTFTEQVTALANFPRELAEAAEPGWTGLFERIGVPTKQITIQRESKIPIYQRVTIGGEEFTRPNYKTPEVKLTISPKGLGKTIAGTGEAALYAIPVLGTSSIASQTAIGGIDLLTGQSPEQRLRGGQQLFLGGLGLFGAKTLEGTNKLFSTRYEVKLTPLQIAEREAKGLLGKPVSVETFKDAFGVERTRVIYPYEIEGRLGSFGKVAKVTEQSYLSSLFGKAPKVVYEGNPYLARAKYQQVVKDLTGARPIVDKKLGKALTPFQARDLVKYQMPKYMPYQSRGMAEIYLGLTENPLIYMEGKTYFPSNIIREGKYSSRGFEPFQIGQELKGTKVKGKLPDTYSSLVSEEKSFLNRLENGKLIPYSKRTQAGKTTKQYQQLSAARSLGNIEYSLPTGEKGLFEVKPAEVYTQRAISREVKTSTRLGKPSLSKAKLVVFKGEPDVKIFYEAGGKIEKTQVFPTGESVDYLSKEGGKQLVKDLKDIYGIKKVNKLPTRQETRNLFGKAKDFFGEVKGTSGDVLQEIINKGKAEAQKLFPSTSKVVQREVKLTDFSIPKAERSAYYGAGTYERTLGGILPTTKEQQGSIEDLGLGERQREVQRENQIVRELFYNKESEKQNEKLFQAQPLLSNERVTQRESISQSERIRERQAERLAQELFSPTISKQSPLLAPPLTPKPNKRLVPPKIKEAPSIKLKGQFARQSKRDIFSVELRRFGKFKTIARTSTPQSAIAIGKTSARQTLGASIRVRTPTGFLAFRPSEEFRLSKKSPNILVQRMATRLSSFGEKREIKQSRNIAKKFWRFT